MVVKELLRPNWLASAHKLFSHVRFLCAPIRRTVRTARTNLTTRSKSPKKMVRQKKSGEPYEPKNSSNTQIMDGTGLEPATSTMSKYPKNRMFSANFLGNNEILYRSQPFASRCKKMQIYGLFSGTEKQKRYCTGFTQDQFLTTRCSKKSVPLKMNKPTLQVQTSEPPQRFPQTGCRLGN